MGGQRDEEWWPQLFCENVRWSHRLSFRSTLLLKMVAPVLKVELSVWLKQHKNIREENRVCFSFSDPPHCVWLGGGRYSLRPGSGASVAFVPVDIVDKASLSVWVGRGLECTCCTPPAISLLFSNLQQAWWMWTQLIAPCQLSLIPSLK